MAYQDSQKDFFTWWNEDFAPTLIEARKALEPHIRHWEEISIVLNSAITSFIYTHQEAIDLWANFPKIYPKIEPHINNIIQGLNDPDLEIGNDVVLFVHILKSIDIQKDSSAASLLDVISHESFQKSLVDLYESLSLDQDRLKLIKEALELHSKRYYAGSICLLYGLIEGVLTESFEKLNYIIINNKRINPIDIDGAVNNRRHLTGLSPKLDHAITHQDQLKAHYTKIKTYELVAGSPDQTIPKTRNEVLHGGSTTFNTEKRSAQLILWLYSSMLHLQLLGI